MRQAPHPSQFANSCLQTTIAQRKPRWIPDKQVGYDRLLWILEFDVFLFRCFGQLVVINAFQPIHKSITLLLIRRAVSSPG